MHSNAMNVDNMEHYHRYMRYGEACHHINLLNQPCDIMGVNDFSESNILYSHFTNVTMHSTPQGLLSSADYHCEFGANYVREACHSFSSAPPTMAVAAWVMLPVVCVVLVLSCLSCWRSQSFDTGSELGSINNAYMYHNAAAGASDLQATPAQPGDVQYDNFIGGPDTVILNPMALQAEKDNKHRQHYTSIYNNNSYAVAGLSASDNPVVLTNVYINRAMVI